MKIKRYKPSWNVHQGCCLDIMKHMSSGSVHCVVTSPPYWALRDYQVKGQHGLEKTIDKWLKKQTQVFAEVHRILRDDGTLWLNIGDNFVEGRMQGQPWKLAFGLIEQGWRLRMDNIWHKPNPHPEPLSRKRPMLSHEYIFLFSKSKHYYYDSEVAGSASLSVQKFAAGGAAGEGHFAAFPDALPRYCIQYGTSVHGTCEVCSVQFERKFELTELGLKVRGKLWHDHKDDDLRGQRNKGLANIPASELRRFTGWRRPCEHKGFGIVPATVFDPYGGSGTSGRVALAMGRSAILIELNPEWADLAKRNMVAGQSAGGRVSIKDLRVLADQGRMGSLEKLLFAP